MVTTRRVVAFAQLPLFLLILACDPAGPSVPEVATIQVTPATGTLTAIEDTLQLQAAAYDPDGNQIPGTAFSWASSPPDVVSVDATGLATARGGGVATVTASAGDASGAAEIHVVQEVAAVEVSPAEWQPTWIGARTRFTATARDPNGHIVPDVAVQWASLKPGVVTVDTAGIATARSAGQAEISATHEEVSGTAAVSVTDGGSGSTPPGLVYTVWAARSYQSPALLVDGSLTIPPPVMAGGVDQVYGEIIPWASDGKPPSPWGEPNVAKFEWSGNRIGLLTDVVGGLGTARVIGRTGEWVEMAVGQARDLQLRGREIMLLDAGGRLRTTSSVGGSWSVLEPGGVVEFHAEVGPRVLPIWLREDGKVTVGGIRIRTLDLPPWTAYQGEDVREFHVSVTSASVTDPTPRRRVGILLEGGELRVRTGMDGDWEVLEPSGVADFRLEGHYIAVLKEDGTLLVKGHLDGLDTPWQVIEYAPIKQFDLKGGRLAILTEDGQFLDRDNAITGSWSPYAFNGVRQFELQDSLTAVLTEAGDLFVRRSNNEAFIRGSPETYPTSSVTQIRPLVHVPLRPWRMTPAGYHQSRAECIHKYDENGDKKEDFCYPELNYIALPVPEYGRFCGGFMPRDGYWDEAEIAGPLDPLDELCHHHDWPHSPDWYYGLDTTWDGPEAACIVRYGLFHSRLTQDGNLQTKGSDSWEAWDAAWGGAMPALKDGLDAYFVFTEICTDGLLQSFTAKTQAPWYY